MCGFVCVGVDVCDCMWGGWRATFLSHPCSGYGFVDFESSADAMKAVQSLQAAGVMAQFAKVPQVLLHYTSFSCVCVHVCGSQTKQNSHLSSDTFICVLTLMCTHKHTNTHTHTHTHTNTHTLLFLSNRSRILQTSISPIYQSPMMRRYI